MSTKEPKMQDEYIEAVWILRERGTHQLTALQEYCGEAYDQEITDQLLEEGLIDVDSGTGKIVFTEAGEQRGRKLIRAHRLAERLLYDVLGIEDYELAACEFEHIMDTDLIDSICTLLGHPRRCPDGLPIPKGACCRAERKTIRSPSVSVLELKPEESGRVIAVNAESDHQLHILDLLQIRPGTIVRLHQRYPSIVIECDGSNIAIDEEIASCIHVWKLNKSDASDLIRKRHIPHGRGDGRGKRKRGYDCGSGGLHGERPSGRGRGWRFWESRKTDDSKK